MEGLKTTFGEEEVAPQKNNSPPKNITFKTKIKWGGFNDPPPVTQVLLEDSKRHSRYMALKRDKIR